MMQVYDGKSSVKWFYGGLMTFEQMRADPRKRLLTEVPCVLIDDGQGTAYDYRTIQSMCAEYGVEYTGDSETDMASISYKISNPDPTPEALAYQAKQTADETKSIAEQAQTAAQTASETAAAAQTTADEAKEIASQAGTDPSVMAFARMAVLPMAATMTDEQALSVSTLWPEWSAESVSYKVDDVVQHAGHLWRCEQAHTSQESWTPDAAPSLWSKIDIAGDGVDVWTQPTGAHNAYDKGDRVHYPTASDPIYVSLIDGNVWAPDAYPAGWQLEQTE